MDGLKVKETILFSEQLLEDYGGDMCAVRLALENIKKVVRGRVLEPGTLQEDGIGQVFVPVDGTNDALHVSFRMLLGNVLLLTVVPVKDANIH